MSESAERKEEEMTSSRDNEQVTPHIRKTARRKTKEEKGENRKQGEERKEHRDMDGERQEYQTTLKTVTEPRKFEKEGPPGPRY